MVLQNSFEALRTFGHRITIAIRLGIVKSPRAISWMVHTKSRAATAPTTQNRGNTYLNFSATLRPKRSFSPTKPKYHWLIRVVLENSSKLIATKYCSGGHTEAKA